MNVQHQIQSTAYLSPKHKSHIESRGLLNNWSLDNCRTVTENEASLYLGYVAKSGGILFMGKTTQFQFRPDKPWKSPGYKKAPKYRTPVGEYDAFLPEHPTDKDYWDVEKLKKHCWHINDHPYLIVTEGAFKAIAGCSYNLPTIALMGTSMGLTAKKSDLQGQRYLVPTLKLYAQAGFGFIIAFDADAATNPSVIWEQRKLGHQLLKFGVPVRSITGQWEPGTEGETKGMDDFIQRKGIEEFRQMLIKSVSFQEWETNLDADGNEFTASKPPTPRKLARQLADDYGQIWKFDNETKTWRIWTGKHWERTDDGNFRTLVKTTIDARNIDYKGSSYITDVLSLLTDDLRVKHWDIWDRKRYIAFDDSVWDSETGEILEHSPGMGFTSFLPYRYKPLTGTDSDAIDTLRHNCPNIYQWMNTVMQGDRQKILKLLAIVNGLLKFRFFDLQMFVHLIGKPGSGKGTFIRLLQKIVGRENWKGCKLRSMDDGSTMASIIEKQLVACPDERAASGVDAILSMTGGDAVSYREVYKPASDAFFYGLLIVGSNNPIFVGDTTGLDRRLCLVHFDNPLPAVVRNSRIEAGMDAEISQLIAVALNLSDSTVSERIQGVGKNQVAEFKFQEWDMKLQTNSVAAHFDDCLIVDPTASTPTGKLYEHYKNWCDSNLKAVSHIKYPKMLSELCNDYLELSGVKWKRSGGRSWFEGLRFRTEGETSPTHSDSLSALIPQNISTGTGYNTGSNDIDTGLMRDLETLPDGNYSHLQGLESQNISEKLRSSPELAEESPGTSNHICEKLEPSPELAEESPDTSNHICEKLEPSPELAGESPDTSNDICEKLGSSSGLTGETEITSHEVEIIKKVGSYPANPIEIPEPLSDLDLRQPTNPVPTPCEPRETPDSCDEPTLQSVAASNEPTADRDAADGELVQRLQARILQVIADNDPAAANDVYSEVHQSGVKEAVKAALTDAENQAFRQLVKLWKETKTQP